MPNRLWLAAGVAGLGASAVAAARGGITLDFGMGRRTRPLGPIQRTIAASPELVFDVVAGPYLRTPQAMVDKLRVWERGEDMVLAEHLTPNGPVTTSTLETVRFERPERIHFRLVRGPVPHVAETFELRPLDDGTSFVYSGELGTDLWWFGARWGDVVARSWERVVAGSIDEIQAEAERRAGLSGAS